MENRVNSGNPATGDAVGNPEPSRRYTGGRCRDYRRGGAPLITGTSARPEREEIVRADGNIGTTRRLTTVRPALYMARHPSQSALG